MKNGIYVLIAFALAPLALSQNITKNDFAFGGKIESTSNKSLVDFPVPEEVYQSVKNNHLLDVAVFNSKDELVPHLVISPPSKLVEKERESVDLTLFPVYSSSSDNSNFSHMKVTKDGAIVEIQGGNTSKAKKRLVGYIFDASKYKKTIDTVHVTIDSGGDYFEKVDVEGSADLRDWTTIERGAVLARFTLNKETLLRSELSLQSDFNYYRIVRSDASQDLKIVFARAFLASEKETVQQPLQWKIVSGTPVPDEQKKVIYQFDTGGFYPLSAVKVKFADKNSVANFALDATNDEKGQWTPISTASFYSVTRHDTTFDRVETAFNESKYRYWRLTLLSNQGGIGSKFPEVSFGWRPQTIRFLARGEGPFLLAYGSAKTNNPPQPDLVRADLSDDVGTATYAGKVSLGGADKLIVEVVPSKSEQPWRKYILGGVLVLGVLVLGAMGLQLRKQV